MDYNIVHFDSNDFLPGRDRFLDIDSERGRFFVLFLSFRGPISNTFFSFLFLLLSWFIIDTFEKSSPVKVVVVIFAVVECNISYYVKLFSKYVNQSFCIAI